MKKIIIPTVIIALALSACQGNEEQQSTTTDQDTTMVETPEETAVEESKPSEASLDSMRAVLEAKSKESKAVELATSGLRDKIKQKWERIHYYKDEAGVYRIKTYPYANISKRTEEFYFNNGELFMVTIEDMGEGEAGSKATDAFDKKYYFHKGELLSESNKTEEAEYNVRAAEAEELLQEAAEYLDLFKTTQSN